MRRNLSLVPRSEPPAVNDEWVERRKQLPWELDEFYHGHFDLEAPDEPSDRPPICFRVLVGPERKRVTGGAPIIAQAYDAAQRLLDVEGPTKRLLLRGPSGCGKSTVAAAVVVELAEQRLWSWTPRSDHDTDSFIWLTCPRFGWDMAHGAKPLDWQIAGAFRAQVLVLDDLGLERTHSPKAVATIGEIIRHRHESERRTITTTGFSHNELADIYGSGIARRLGDRGITIEWGKR